MLGGLNAYVIAALVVAVMVGAAGFQGYRLGGDSERAAEAERRAEEVKEAREREVFNLGNARQEGKTLAAALGKQKGLTSELATALQNHIAAMPAPPAGCPAPALTDGLRDDWNRANAGSAAGGIVPTASRSATGSYGLKPASGDPKSR